MNVRLTLMLAMTVTVLAALAGGLGVRAADDPFDEATPAPKSPAPAKPAAVRIFLDKSPAVIAYQLRRLTNQQLVLLERKADEPKYKPIYEALLTRQGLPQKYRDEALAALVALNKSDAVTQLLAAVQRVRGDAADQGAVLHDLVHMLKMQTPAALAARRDRIEAIATGADGAMARQVGYLGLVLADASVERAWTLASQQDTGRRDVMGCLPMIDDAALRAAFYPHVQPLLQSAPDDETRQAAIDAVSFIPGHEADTFTTLAGFIAKGAERAAAVRSIRRLPAKSWSDAPLATLADSLVQYVKSIPADQRTEPAAIDAVQLGYDVAAKLPPDKGASIRRTLGELGVRVILLRTIPHQMLFDTKYFAVQAGRPVQVVLQNLDMMPHNLVILAPGSLEEIGQTTEHMQPTSDPDAVQYVPDSPKVLHATHLLQTDQTARLNFTAPSEPGEYPFLCTFPGHWRRMYGLMLVVPDLEAWLAKPTEPADPLGNTRKFVREWKVQDLAHDLAAIDHGRSFDTGRKIFTELGCILCHKIRDQGANIGPDLTEVFKRWKGVRQDMLLQIIEPSKVVDPKFQTYLVETFDGDRLYGLITSEDKNTISIVTNPRNPVPQKLAKSDIADRFKAPNSMMPVGLLNMLQKDEILDLLAFLESGGDPNSKLFK